jgi:uncharacterized protein YbjT (DUF2867 family)
MPTNILIVGATGKQGRQALTTLLDSPNASSDLSLRFLTRNPDKDSLRKALSGVERAFLVTDAMAGEEKEKEQGMGFVDVAKEQGVKHLVFTSVCSADTALTVPHFRSKFEVSGNVPILTIGSSSLFCRLRNT